MLHQYLAVIVSLNLIGAASAFAQARLSTIEDVRRAVQAGDIISVVQTTGRPITGKLIRFNETELVTQPTGSQQQVTIPFSAVRSLERRRDSTQDGALIGAAIGGGIVLVEFVHGAIVDRNEMDEWGPSVAMAGVVVAGIGALIGWAIDHDHSKPHVRYDAASTASTTIRVVPLFVRGAGMGVSVSF